MKIEKRFISMFGMLIFCGFSSYNLFWGWLIIPNMEKNTDIIQSFVCAILMSVIYPGIIFFQFLYIRKLLSSREKIDGEPEGARNEGQR